MNRYTSVYIQCPVCGDEYGIEVRFVEEMQGDGYMKDLVSSHDDTVINCGCDLTIDQEWAAVEKAEKGEGEEHVDEQPSIWGEGVGIR